MSIRRLHISVELSYHSHTIGNIFFHCYRFAAKIRIRSHLISSKKDLKRISSIRNAGKRIRKDSACHVETIRQFSVILHSSDAIYTHTGNILIFLAVASK